MKKLINHSIILLAISVMVLLSSCYGSFTMTKKLYSWNGTVGNKFAKEAVFLALNIIPAYGVCVFIDGIFLNSVEFWTGSNPMALKEGENNINYKGKNYKIYLTENRAVIYNEENVEQGVLNYNKYNQTWYITVNGETKRIMSISDDKVSAYNSDGTIVSATTNGVLAVN